MNPHSNIENQQIDNQAKNDALGGAAEATSPQPFAFLQPFGEEGVGVCDVEGNCS